MTEQEIEAMILALMCEADYDLYKSLKPELAEDPESAQHQMEALKAIVLAHLPGIETKR